MRKTVDPRNQVTPDLNLPSRHPDIPVDERPTVHMAVVNNPVTPIPDFVQLQPFFSGYVPLPPSPNGMSRLVANRRIIESGDLRRFKNDADMTLSKADINHVVLHAVQQGALARKLSERPRLAVRLRPYFESLYKRDLDGVIKYSVDAVFRFLGLNDILIFKYDEFEKLQDVDFPRIEIEIRLLSR